MKPWEEIILKPRSTYTYPILKSQRLSYKRENIFYTATVSLNNNGYYQWRIVVQDKKYYSTFVKGGVCRSLERAQNNCDRFMKKRLKLRLLSDRHYVFA